MSITFFNEYYLFHKNPHVVDSNELCPVYPFQLKQLKYEDPEDEGAVGATMNFMVDFGIYIHILLEKFDSHVRSLLWQGVPGWFTSVWQIKFWWFSFF